MYVFIETVDSCFITEFFKSMFNSYQYVNCCGERGGSWVMNLVKQALGKRVITVCCRHQRKGSGVRGSKDCQSMINLKQKSDMKPPADEDGKLTQLETAQTGRVGALVTMAIYSHQIPKEIM